MPPTPEDIEFRFAQAFETTRDGFISQFPSSYPTSTLDRFEFNGDQDLLVMSVTAGWGTEQYMAEDAFTITRDMASLWNEEGLFVPGVWVPGLQVTVDEFTATCPADFMLRLADTRADRAAFDAEC